MNSFENELQTLINKYSMEQDSNTPDFILAEYINQALAAWAIGVNRRDAFYNFTPNKERTDNGT